MSVQTTLWDWIAGRNPPSPKPAPQPAPPSRRSEPPMQARVEVPVDAAVAGLHAELIAAGLTVRLRIHRNRRIALGLRGRPGAWRLGVHADLVADADLRRDLPAWIRSGGRQRLPGIQAALARLGDRLMESAPSVAAEPLGGPIDLPAMAADVHARWFADLPMPEVAWSRDSHRARQHHIRFGSYWRRERRILLHPRLDQPWVARVFVEHVIHHEFCHHRQACQAVRGETAHSARFRQWERAYPDYDLAMAWERANRGRLLRAPSG
jgi:hypothetical protein